MDKYDYLRLMINHRNLWEDSNAEIYFDSHEKYFEIVDHVVGNEIPDEKEIKMLLQTFCNIDIYEYLVESMIDRLFKFIDVSEENFIFVIEWLFDHDESYYMLNRLIWFLDDEDSEYISKVIEKLTKMRDEGKFYISKCVAHSGIEPGLRIMNIIGNSMPECTKKYKKIEFEDFYLYDEPSLYINKKDIQILNLLQGYKLYLNSELYIHVFSEGMRKKELSDIGLSSIEIKIIIKVKDYYLIEHGGYYYLRERENLNVCIYDVPVGNSLEDVIKNTHLFDWVE